MRDEPAAACEVHVGNPCSRRPAGDAHRIVGRPPFVADNQGPEFMSSLRQTIAVRNTTGTTIAQDIAAIGRIEAVPRLLRTLCDVTGMGFSAVARVTDDRWVACAVQDDILFGLQPGGELPLESTLCHEVRQADASIYIDHASEDPTYCSHHTPLTYHIESYVSVPIKLPNGDYFGNLCAIDPRPHKVKLPHVETMFDLFAQLIGVQLEEDRRRQLTEAQLLDERASSELREQFIAVLGHDLRNPLAAISACNALLKRKPGDAALVAATAQRIERSTSRMSALINDVLDFARGRLGGGIGMNLKETDELGAGLATVVAELRDAWQDRKIAAHIAVDGQLRCDVGRIQQLASNLIGNALSHGSASSPVRFDARLAGNDLVIEVHNEGEPIPPDRLDQVFAPFWRRTASREGLGLGLYICAQIVKSHQGELSVVSEPGAGTTFTARMPVGR